MSSVSQERKLIPKKRSLDEMNEVDSYTSIMHQLDALESAEQARHLTILTALQSVKISLNQESQYDENALRKRVKIDNEARKDLKFQGNDSSSIVIKSEAGQQINSKLQIASNIALGLTQRLLGETIDKQRYRTLQLLLNPELLKKARAQGTLKEVMSVVGSGLQRLLMSTEPER